MLWCSNSATEKDEPRRAVGFRERNGLFELFLLDGHIQIPRPYLNTALKLGHTHSTNSIPQTISEDNPTFRQKDDPDSAFHKIKLRDPTIMPDWIVDNARIL